jgi:hypothetical protein
MLVTIASEISNIFFIVPPPEKRELEELAQDPQLLQCLPSALTVGARDRCLRSRRRLYQGSGDVAGSGSTALRRRSLEIREQLFLLILAFLEGALGKFLRYRPLEIGAQRRLHGRG